MSRAGVSFAQLLRQNPNYRYTWIGQIVSETGDHFNTIAVFSLALHNTGSGLVVSGLMIARALPIVLAGPLAGVLLVAWNGEKMYSSGSRRLPCAMMISSICSWSLSERR